MTTYITLFNLTDAGIICDVAKCSGRQGKLLTRSRLLRGFANPRGGLLVAAPGSLELHRRRRVGAAHAAQAGSFSARMSTGSISGRPSSSSSARPSRAAATAP